MQFEADYYDGISARAKRVLVNIVGPHLEFTVSAPGADGVFSNQVIHVLIDNCHVQARLGSGKRFIDLPDDGRLETDFTDLESHLPKRGSSAFWRCVHYSETHKFSIVTALVGIVLACAALLMYGLPATAKYAALATPASLELSLGKQTLQALDSEALGYFKETGLSVEDQREIETALSSFCAKTLDCPIYSLNFRKSPVIGANALALPGGQLLITDELIDLANNTDEVIAVLAHELGHVKGRHALRQALQGTLSGLVIVAITGDVSSIASGLPALMINMSYSRELETEADLYSLQSLITACIPTRSFATLLQRLENSHGGGSGPEFISSHPDTNLRIVPFLKDYQCKSG